MPAPAIPLDVPFGPLDTKTDPYAMPPGTLTVAENATAQTAHNYTTRLPYAQLTTTAGPTAVVAAMLRKTELLVADGQTLWTYDAATATWPAIDHRSISEAFVTRQGVARDQTAGLFRPTIAISANGVIVVAWLSNTNSSHITVACYDSAGVGISTPQIPPPGQTAVNIRLVANGNSVVLFQLSTSGAKIEAFRLDTTSFPLTWSSPSTISTNVHATSVILDAWPVGSDIALLWAKTDGVLVGQVNPTTLAVGTLVGQLATLTAGSGGGITGTTGEKIYAAWWDSVAGLKAWVLTTAFANSAGPTVVDSYITNPIDQVGLCRFDSTHAAIVWEESKAGASFRADAQARDLTKFCKFSDAAVVTSTTSIGDMSVVSKPTSYNGSFYVHLMYDSTQNQSTYFLARIFGTTPPAPSSRVPAGMDVYRQAIRDGKVCGLTDMPSPSAGVITTALLVATKYLSQSTPVAAIDLATFSLVAPTRYQASQLSDVLLLASSIGMNYDGVQSTEIQFLTFPEGMTFTPATSGGSMADGTYQYILIYEWTDAFGNTHQSTTSIAASATVSGGGGAGKVTITNIPTIPFPVTFRQNYGGTPTAIPAGYGPIILSVFRTAPTVSVGIYYFVASQTANASGLVVLNQTDGNSDATISTRRQLYITGGALDKEPPLPCSALISHQNGLWGVSSEDPQLLFYSGDYFPGVAPWFSTGFQVRCDTGGAITALASLDDKVILFKSDRIFYVSGSRPNATGTGSSLTPPQLISTDVGCSEPRSIVRTGDGIYFLTSKGIYLLDRGLNVVYVGAPVEGYVQHYANCVAATLLPDRQEIRWEFTGPDGAQSWSQVARKIVYNYSTKRWTTHLNYSSLVPVTATGGVGVRYVWFTSTGVGYQEAAAAGTDPSSTFIPLVLESGWLAPTGPQGLTRAQYIILLANRVSAHGTTIELARNYDNTYAQSITFPDTSTFANDQRSWNVPAQQGESFRVRVTTTADNSSGQGFGASMTAVGIRLIALAKRGSFNKFMSATQKG